MIVSPSRVFSLRFICSPWPVPPFTRQIFACAALFSPSIRLRKMFQLRLDRIRPYRSIVILYIAPLAQKKVLHLCDSKESSFQYNPLENAALFFCGQVFTSRLEMCRLNLYFCDRVRQIFIITVVFCFKGVLTCVISQQYDVLFDYVFGLYRFWLGGLWQQYSGVALFISLFRCENHCACAGADRVV